MHKQRTRKRQSLNSFDHRGDRNEERSIVLTRKKSRWLDNCVEPTPEPRSGYSYKSKQSFNYMGNALEGLCAKFRDTEEELTNKVMAYKQTNDKLKAALYKAKKDPVVAKAKKDLADSIQNNINLAKAIANEQQSTEFLNKMLNSKKGNFLTPKKMNSKSLQLNEPDNDNILDVIVLDFKVETIDENVDKIIFNDDKNEDILILEVITVNTEKGKFKVSILKDECGATSELSYYIYMDELTSKMLKALVIKALSFINTVDVEL